jgi:hypothetical protein
MAFTAVVVPVSLIAGASTSGGSTGSSGIWAGVSYYWGEWSGSRSNCTWTLFLGQSNIDGVPGAALPPRRIAGVDYRLFMRVCPSGHHLIWVPQVPPVLLDHWSGSFLSRWLPRPPLHLAPPAAHQVVNVGTWFWTDASAWEPVSITAWIPTPEGPLWVTTTARPTRLVLDPGDGRWGSGPVNCLGPGVSWSPGLGDGAPSPFGCDYTYRHSSSRSPNGSTFTARLSTVWAVSWRASTGEAGSAGELQTSTSTQVTVHELEGIGQF